MRVVMVVPWVADAAGGTAAATVGAARQLAALGHRVDVLATDAAIPSNAKGFRRVSPDEVAVIEERLHPATLTVHASSRPHRLAWSRSLASSLPSALLNADALDVHGLWLHPVIAAPLAARRAGIPYLIWPHGALSPAFARRGRLRKSIAWRAGQSAAIGGASGLVIASSLEGSWLAGVAPSVPRILFRHPVEPSCRAAPIAAERRERTLLWAGRLGPVKRPDLAIRLLAGAGKDLRLSIAGPDGSGMAPELRALAAGLGVADRIDWLGEVRSADLRDQMARALAVLVTSDTENYSLIVAEAMAEGTPAIVSPGVGLGELVRATGAGLVLEGTGDSWGRQTRALTEDHRAWVAAADATREARAQIEPAAGARALEAIHVHLTTGSGASSAPTAAVVSA